MDLDYIKYESQYGVMYHLLLDRIGTNTGVRFVNGDDPNPKFITVCGKPVFFNWDKEYCIALDYTIIFPKLYVKKAVLLTKYEIKRLSRQYIQ